MPARLEKFWITEESSFVVLRALAMLGGMVAVLLIPHPPEHQPYLGSLAWGFVAYKVSLFVTIATWPTRLRAILLGSVGLDLAFVSLFVWFGGGLHSHFYLLFYLLVALAAAHFSLGIGLSTAGAAGALYAVAAVGDAGGGEWQHLIARVATLFLLGGSLGYLSQRERLARARAEELNRSLQENQTRLERAYQALQAAQARLVQSERLATIGQMSAKVSHEVRNPLSSISLNVELLDDELASLPAERRVEAAHLVTAIRSQVDVLSTVTEEYLRFARLPKPRLEIATLSPVIEELTDFVREELRARKVDLVVKIQEKMPSLRLDARQIRRALLNLIRNATEAMPEGGTLTVTLRAITGIAECGMRNAESTEGESARQSAIRNPQSEIGEWLEVTVTDTGIGIPAEDREKVFEPFYTNKEGGTGLGLAISRQIAVDHGGTLACEDAPGGGTSFRLRLPVPDEGHNR
jgi:signal transduction histidine kinase